VCKLPAATLQPPRQLLLAGGQLPVAGEVRGPSRWGVQLGQKNLPASVCGPAKLGQAKPSRLASERARPAPSGRPQQSGGRALAATLQRLEAARVCPLG